jgi:2'-5' RNA ligase
MKQPSQARPFHPHVTIAFRDLTKENFEQAWQHYSGKPFKESFAANSLSLLKLTGDGWIILKSFDFYTTKI